MFINYDVATLIIELIDRIFLNDFQHLIPKKEFGKILNYIYAMFFEK